MMKAMFIERYNIAARMILKLLLEGSHGNCYSLADVGLQIVLGTWAHLIPGCQIGSYLIQNCCARDSAVRHCDRTSSSLLLCPPYLQNRTCTCTSQDLCAALLETQYRLWRWDTAQHLVIMINSWRSSNNMSL